LLGIDLVSLLLLLLRALLVLLSRRWWVSPRWRVTGHPDGESGSRGAGSRDQRWVLVGLICATTVAH